MNQIIEGLECSVCGRDGVLKKYLPKSNNQAGGIQGYFCSEGCKAKKNSDESAKIGFMVLISSLFIYKATNVHVFIKILPIPIFMFIHALVEMNKFHKSKSSSIEKSSSKSSNTNMKSKTKKSTSNNPDENIPQSIYVPELSRKVPLCCYQTARLGDGYCICGRVVSPQLHELFNT